MQDKDPERIYLQPDEYPERDDMPGDGRTWCVDNISGRDTEYVRADLLAQSQARVQALEAVSNVQRELIGWYEGEFERFSHDDVCSELLDIETRLVAAEAALAASAAKGKPAGLGDLT